MNSRFHYIGGVMMRCYVTQDNQEHIDLFELNGKDRLPYFRITQDLGQTLIDLYYGDFEAAYSIISEIGKELGSLYPGRIQTKQSGRKSMKQIEDLNQNTFSFRRFTPNCFFVIP